MTRSAPNSRERETIELGKNVFLATPYTGKDGIVPITLHRRKDGQLVFFLIYKLARGLRYTFGREGKGSLVPVSFCLF